MKVVQKSFSRKIVKYLPRSIRNKLPAQMEVVSVSTQESLALNRRYRKKRTPTNVLSFLYSPEYGEIILCLAVIRLEARAAGNTFHAQMTWMIVHGMLHLSGTHHEASAGAEQRFLKIEQRVLRKYKNR